MISALFSIDLNVPIARVLRPIGTGMAILFIEWKKIKWLPVCLFSKKPCTTSNLITSFEPIRGNRGVMRPQYKGFFQEFYCHLQSVRPLLARLLCSPGWHLMPFFPPLQLFRRMLHNLAVMVPVPCTPPLAPDGKSHESCKTSCPYSIIFSSALL